MNSKYINTKQNWTLEVKFFGPFWVLYQIGKQAYKVKLPKKWGIHNIFYILLLEKDIIKKKCIDENMIKLDAGNKNSKEYKVKTIWDSAVYAKKLKSSQLPGFYYLVVWKSYSEEKNT